MKKENKTEKHPQEIEVWYVLPSLRRELAKKMAEKALAQKQIAKLLGITEAAVSQYLSAKRGKEVKFGKEFEGKIREKAKEVSEGRVSAYEALSSLCRDFRESGELCFLHRKMEKVPKSCTLCMK
ncbi:transcriptional regulator [Candidatus Micrarchaeota archaeon]|nr:transcriptional regulator [Candidatus Micrarchaeota archaeon]